MVRRKNTKISAILRLPVQYLPLGNFNSSQLTWTPIPNGTSRVYDVAVVPYARMEDFVRGESNHPQCPTNFARTANKTRRVQCNPGAPPRDDGVLLYHTYSCSYGRADYRTQPSHPGDNTSRPNRERRKRGCTCHFSIKQLVVRPSDIIITYLERRHVDKNGVPCHGPEDPTSFGKQPLHAMHLSSEIKHWVLSLLYSGLRPKAIHDKHTAHINKKNEMDPNRKASRDDFLKTRDIHNLCNSLYNSQYHLHPNDDDSVHRWVERNRNKVFFFRRDSNHSFILGIQTEWQLEQIIRFGHNNVLSLDSTFGTNKFKYPLYTVLAFDAHQSSLPVAWIIAEEATREVITLWVQALRKRVLDKSPSWKPSLFLVDDVAVEIQAISKEFDCLILLSLWHVRQSWLKRLLKDVHDMPRRSEMFRILGDIMQLSTSEEQAMKSLVKFRGDFSTEGAFLSYFERKWMPQIGHWLRARSYFAQQNQVTNAAIESYHSSLKERYINEIRSMSDRRLDWLIFKLTNEVHSYYWFVQFVKKNGFNQNFDVEHIQATSWQKALEIPDDDVSYDPVNSQFAKVRSQTGDRSHYYTVWNPGLDYALCDCSVATKANTCKHVLKVCMLIQGRLMKPDYTITHFPGLLEGPKELDTVPGHGNADHMEGVVGGQEDAMGIQHDETHASEIRSSLITTLHSMIKTLPHDLASLEDAQLSITRCNNELKCIRERFSKDLCHPILPGQHMDAFVRAHTRKKTPVKAIYRRLKKVAQLHRDRKSNIGVASAQMAQGGYPWSEKWRLKKVAQLHRDCETNIGRAAAQIAQGGHPQRGKRRRLDRPNSLQRLSKHACCQDNYGQVNVPTMASSYGTSSNSTCQSQDGDQALLNHVACGVLSKYVDGNVLQAGIQQEQLCQMLFCRASDAIQVNTQHKHLRQWLCTRSNASVHATQVGIQLEQWCQMHSSGTDETLQDDTQPKQI